MREKAKGMGKISDSAGGRHVGRGKQGSLSGMASVTAQRAEPEGA